MTPFSQLNYQRPDVPAVLETYKQLIARANAAQTGEELVAVYKAHDAADQAYGFAANLCNIRHTLDTTDPFYDEETAFFDEHTPAVGNIQLELYRAFLASPHRQALADAYGDILLKKMEIAVKSADDRVLALMQEDNRLVSAYIKLYASVKVEFDGKTLTLAQLGPYKQSTDRAVRKAAYEAEGAFFDAHREELDSLYGQMVECRNAQARALGYKDYSELSYLRMGRIDYGPEEVARYRRQVVRDVVPAIAQLQARRMKRVEVADPKFYDLGLYFKDGNPTPHGTPEQLLAWAKQMYHELSPETARFIDDMFQRETFDVLSRPGKAQGGYCETIPGYGPFVFSNFNGTSGDVDVLTHEAGHAFQAYVAMENHLPGELASPGMESCEIHSMSMEFLTSPWHHLFFGPDTAKYQLYHAEDSLSFLPYGCLVDEFQQIMYQQPHLTPDERNQVWLELEHKYRPWIDFADLPFYGRGAGWQRQLHIYECPFYYIDYCLAQTVALQFFAAHLADPKDAWQRYLALVRQAGTASYPQLVKAAGLAVPFEDGSLAPVAHTVAQWIVEHQV